MFIVEDDLVYVYILKKYLIRITDCGPILEFSNGQEAFDKLFQITDNGQL